MKAIGQASHTQSVNDQLCDLANYITSVNLIFFICTRETIRLYLACQVVVRIKWDDGCEMLTMMNCT